MEDYFKSIAQHIEKGTYFEDAKSWYATKYLLPVVDRSYFLLLIALCGALTIYCFATILTFLPLSKNVPIVIEISDLSKEYTRMLPLAKQQNGEGLKDSDLAIQQYHLSNYITARESYDYADEYALLEKNKRIIRAFSSKTLGDQFERGLSIRNPRSPILRFRNHTTRSLNINNNSIGVTKINSQRRRQTESGNPLLSYRAAAPFTIFENGPDGITQKKWNATIDFLYSPVTYSREQREFDQIEFTVINYQIAEAIR